jgi:FtsZ-interacting cell division protein ZipA
MLEHISAENQLILVVIAIAILFVLVLWNNKRNQKKRYEREQRNFRKTFYNKKSKKR